ncbi:MAG TPA: haloacid dehalogenase type II [Dehalococcoidia bacterium]|jgi:2-haloacid dehalogenase|nr:haloacid dehalogenase type II [Dehalococcoidia bacterium]|tara:strand:- start:376 stop:1095 length:720 start_codon:yes stop_codon:yes gene_type:complete
MANTDNIRAFIFDVFGTVVNWRGSIISQGENFGAKYNISTNWEEFADKWRGKYRPYMDKVRTGELPWTNLDALHQMSLIELLEELDINGLNDNQIDELVYFWHNLKPWSDTVPGLYRLKNKYIISPMSNGNIVLMADMAKNGSMPWDCILGAEVAQHYKPHPRSYLTAVEILGCTPDQVVMTAAHERDLLAAQEVGLKTAFVTRPMEFGTLNTNLPKESDHPFDFWATDFVDLAGKVGA